MREIRSGPHSDPLERPWQRPSSCGRIRSVRQPRNGFPTPVAYVGAARRAELPLMSRRVACRSLGFAPNGPKKQKSRYVATVADAMRRCC
eukprot:5733916-Prymnesium_polylepis.1